MEKMFLKLNFPGLEDQDQNSQRGAKRLNSRNWPFVCFISL